MKFFWKWVQLLGLEVEQCRLIVNWMFMEANLNGNTKYNDNKVLLLRRI